VRKLIPRADLFLSGRVSQVSTEETRQVRKITRPGLPNPFGELKISQETAYTEIEMAIPIPNVMNPMLSPGLMLSHRSISWNGIELDTVLP